MRHALLLLGALVAACTPAAVEEDAGPQEVVDAGDGADAGPDAGPADAGPLWDGTVVRERSLAWTDAAILDDPSTVGLSIVVGAAAAQLGTTPGALFDAWLRRFATTAHSERAGPARLADQLAVTLGADPSAWNLDDAPFKVTGVHNRVDLMGTADDGTRHCGQLRVSLASTDPLIRPFHLLFLFRQPLRDGDVDADGRITCEQTALSWAELSDLDAAAFLVAARTLLASGLVADRFLLAESVELTVSPWEWRQWTPAGTALDNPPLFEQVNVEGINAPGALRTDFLAFVEQNAAALDARTLLIPDRFRAPSVRVAQGSPWVPLDLTGVSSTLPELRKHIEIVGCAACHTADAEFVQTRDDRTFSPFYTKELVARGALLDDILHHVRRTIPFGPLQDAPLLPP